MGFIATAKVVTRAETVDRPALLQPGYREWVTAIECINAMGWALPPALYSRESLISRLSMRTMLHHQIGGLNLVRMDRQQIKLVSPGFKISLFQ